MFTCICVWCSALQCSLPGGATAHSARILMYMPVCITYDVCYTVMIYTRACILCTHNLYIYMYVYIDIYIHVCVHVRVHMYMCLYIYVYLCVEMYICEDSCALGGARTCVYIFVYTHISIHKKTRVHIYMLKKMYTNKKYIYIHIYTYIYIYFKLGCGPIRQRAEGESS